MALSWCRDLHFGKAPRVQFVAVSLARSEMSQWASKACAMIIPTCKKPHAEFAMFLGILASFTPDRRQSLKAKEPADLVYMLRQNQPKTTRRQECSQGVVVTSRTDVCINSDIIAANRGEVGAAHPHAETKCNGNWTRGFLPRHRLQPDRNLSSYSQLATRNPRNHVPIRRICSPPWGVSPAVMLLPHTSELSGPQVKLKRSMQDGYPILPWNPKPFRKNPMKLSPNVLSFWPGGQQGGNVFVVYLAMDSAGGAKRFFVSINRLQFFSPALHVQQAGDPWPPWSNSPHLLVDMVYLQSSVPYLMKDLWCL